MHKIQQLPKDGHRCAFQNETRKHPFINIFDTFAIKIFRENSIITRLYCFNY